MNACEEVKNTCCEEVKNTCCEEVDVYVRPSCKEDPPYLILMDNVQKYINLVLETEGVSKVIFATALFDNIVVRPELATYLLQPEGEDQFLCINRIYDEMEQNPIAKADTYCMGVLAASLMFIRVGQFRYNARNIERERRYSHSYSDF